MKIINIESFTEFNQYLNSYNNIIINITASWCKPCNIIKPLIEKYIEDIENNNFIYLKIDHSVYENDDNFDEILKMKKIPLFLFLKDKDIEDSIISSDFNLVSNKIFSFINKDNNFFLDNNDF